jgi:hypothetical protein
MEHVIGAKKHLEMHGATTSTMPEKEYVNCARCTKNIAVTDTYKMRMNAKHIPILCNDCRNMSEVTTP